MADIIVVEDNEEIGGLLADFLLAEGYDVYLASSGEEGLAVYESEGAKLVLLDIMLPGMDGFGVCSRIREHDNTPIIMISAREGKEDKLNGLLLGADDYVEKPYDIDILLAKVKGIFQRRYSSNEILDGNLRLDKSGRHVYLKDREMSMTAKEFDLLLYFMENKGKVIPKEELFCKIWGFDSESEPQTLTVHIFEREKGRAANSLTELYDFAGVKEYSFITGMQVLGENADEKRQKDFWNNKAEAYTVVFSPYGYYKITYVPGSVSNRSMIFLINGAALFLMALALVLLLYIRQRIIKPFSRLTELPYELSKGNLTLPLKENKSRFFGKFIWGMDLLRENLEENKRRELELQREKKLLLLSLSHDIKTPLSAIHLYAQALCKNLYRDEKKKQEITGNIRKKAEEIESYIGEIVQASNEDFLDFQVNNQEIYVKEVLEQIQEYYQDKMALNQIEFCVEPYVNCLIWGDAERIVEVIQNVVENAIKYGDGRKIQISSRREEEEYIIRVQNTGCGLVPKELPHIFDSFFRGSNIKQNPGSGLGLYICRQLAHQMEGEITGTVREEEGESIMEVSLALHLV